MNEESKSVPEKKRSSVTQGALDKQLDDPGETH